MTFESHSQAGQDAWVHGKIPVPGSFLDVGCGHPVNGNNTVGLERVGWMGWGIDQNAELCREWVSCRAAPVMCDSAVTFNWSTLIMRHYDYLSLDVDEAQVAALRVILEGGITFKVATVEHDFYRFGSGPRSEIRRILSAAGYRMEREDVTCGDQAFEDWWVRA